MKALTVNLCALLCATLSLNASGAEYPDPERFRAAIDAFNAETDVPHGAVVATGSSSMRGWHGRIKEDLAPLTIVPRGFGGSNMYDVRYFLDDLVLKHKPRAVMIYEGDNDAALGATTEQVMLNLEAIVEEIHHDLPETRIYLLAVKPSIARWGIWPAMEKTNRAMQRFAKRHRLVTYVDVAVPMLDDDGTPKPEIFIGDNLHMNDAGYDVWRDAVRPVVVASEAPHE
ncbi:MAG: GDSL-type esterase/lipase family protein [Pseudomonadota bacterium]